MDSRNKTNITQTQERVILRWNFRTTRSNIKHHKKYMTKKNTWARNRDKIISAKERI